MKVFVPENWDELKGKLAERGRVVEVRKGDGEEECCAFIGKSLRMTAGPKNMREALETLADLGFDYAAIIGFELELEGLEKGLGFKIPKVKSVEEVERAPEVESLKSIVLKTKCVEGVERCGAIGIFIGFVRKESDGKTVSRLEYEAYDEMLNEKAREIEERVKQMAGIVNARVYHKRGILLPGEDIVYITVMGEHRKDIWEPLKEAVELMKKELPIWKKEVYEDGEVWVHDAERTKS
ncbi:MAG: Molybdopterin converting factor, subunit 2 (MoaE) [Archaeoglobus fulgidus]|jgi:molybdopterin synthase catalytic subunit|uniref:Molybdopterin converting factor, subunit 2 (MoaE) n=1 Tax=Archaeoglobus fulgidus TaxID=2234 RepID=A0A117KLX1_ARCFL|nr:molybdenum cofactor biosynthesis protein MoaE [Archaeoglobus fulgidus]KUJ93343.1 MAG: Molybdopterin converting factor, subunit 2 (MoaE) [Archaeoglobus fulgidus]KUK07358.1 MAG: Molybdopterin converting factor, subunit 2 (MoaE) [Archaeoglobus fulgidus]